MVKTAVILAAGRGTRLKELGKEIPKGFLRLGEKPIIQESIEKLARAGVEQVIIVTGHCAEKYEELARSWNARFEQIRHDRTEGGRAFGAAGPDTEPSKIRIRTVHNERYADSGSLYSLYLAGNALMKTVDLHDRRWHGEERRSGKDAEGFLLLESDLVYEYRAVQALQEDSRPDLILVSGRTNSGDEVWVATERGNLRAMSKDRNRLEELLQRGQSNRPAGIEILGELVGISKISGNLFVGLSAVAEGLFKQTLHVEYETGLTETARQYPIPCLLIPDLVWAEIDDANHLERAKGLYETRLL
jgi:2-aminoethylphosphonate-pyruvate transaminase